VPEVRQLVESLVCGHCGSRLPPWQADLYGAAIRQLARMGGDRADTGNQGGNPEEPAPDGTTSDAGRWDSTTLIVEDGAENEDPSLQDTETPPSLCQWIFERLADAGVHPEVILDPCAGRGNLTRPFRPRAKVIEYEIRLGKDFFAEPRRIVCDLVICNPRWCEAERWLQQVVKLVGRETPIVFIAPVVFLSGYKNGPVRKYLESSEAPRLDHYTPLPCDTFVKVYSSGAIHWFNLPNVRDVALVPSRYLVRSNDGGPDPLATTDVSTIVR
jgi:hypothetical protein